MGGIFGMSPVNGLLTVKICASDSCLMLDCARYKFSYYYYIILLLCYQTVFVLLKVIEILMIFAQ